jgi:Holliday junction resolvase RusA-like endonuclease
MSNDNLFTDEFISLLSSDGPDHRRIRRHIIRTYNVANGDDLEETISSDDVRLFPVSVWLNHILMSGDPRAHFFRRKPVLLSAFSSNLSSKIGSLSQFHCPLCQGEAPIVTIPIRIKPISYQASDSMKKRAFKRAIRHRLSETHHYADKRLCIHITFVIGKKSNKRDVDNMAKLLLDGLQGQMMEDDNQIDHLSLLRLTWKGDEEYIILHVRESNINRHDDVLYHSMHHSWAGQEELLLDNFIDA